VRLHGGILIQEDTGVVSAGTLKFEKVGNVRYHQDIYSNS